MIFTEIHVCVYSMFVQVKLDVAMTPEMEVSSTVASGNSNNSSDSDQSNEIPLGATLSTVNLSSSTANIHPSIENQYKVSGVSALCRIQHEY